MEDEVLPAVCVFCVCVCVRVRVCASGACVCVWCVRVRRASEQREDLMPVRPTSHRTQVICSSHRYTHTRIPV